MFHHTRKILLILLAFIALCMCGGVYATWDYAKEPAESVSGTLNPIEIWVPDYKEEGLDFDSLLGALLSHESGLNNSSSFLSKYVNARRTGGSVRAPNGQTILCYRDSNTLGSMALSGDLDVLFSEQNGNIDFLMYFASDTEYYIYTMANGVLPANKQGSSYQNGEVIIHPVWRTKVLYEDTNGDGALDTWVRKEDEIGYARSAYYQQNTLLSSRIYKDKISSINPTTWVKGEYK